MEININFGFSTSSFILCENLATVAPSMIRWSAVMLYDRQSIGSHIFSLPSTYFGSLRAFPIAMIEVAGAKIVGTKYFPPMFPTLLTVNVPLLKSSALSAPLLALSAKSFRSAFIYTILFWLTFFIIGVVRPSLESTATA